VNSKLAANAWLLLRRSIREGLRSPAFAFLFPALFPLFMIALTSQSFGCGSPEGTLLTWQECG